MFTTDLAELIVRQQAVEDDEGAECDQSQPAIACDFEGQGQAAREIVEKNRGHELV